MILDLFGYDRHGEIREISTTLQRNALNTLDVSLAAMAFNAPAWVSAASMSVLYSVVGAAAPLAILISFIFPMLVLALCLVYLTRQAPSALEEARVPVRTVQRSLLAVLSSALLIYTMAAIGWQRAVPVEVLAKITENGDGGPIAAVAKEYLPPAFIWIALFVVVTSAAAGLQVSMTAGARTAYRMAQEGHLPAIFGRTNSHRAPWVSVVTLAAVAIAFVWYKPLSQINFYYNAVVVTLALSYMSALAAFTRLMFARNPPWRAWSASVLPMLAFAVLGYLMYSAGTAPADPKDLYQAWYIGAGVLVSSLAILIFGKRTKQPDTIGHQLVSKIS